jgi:hypothetical protein
MTYYSEAIVAKLKIDGILGLDFMKAHQCSVDISNEVLVVNGREKRLSIEGFLGCCRITAAETVSIPQRSEGIVPGKVCVPEGSLLPTCESIVETLYSKTRNECEPTARTVVRPRETVSTRLMDTVEDIKGVHSGTVIGKLSEVNHIETSSPEERSICTNVLGADPPELLQKRERNLPPPQKTRCDYLTDQKGNYLRHLKRDHAHQAYGYQTTSQQRDSDNSGASLSKQLHGKEPSYKEEWLLQDPDITLQDGAKSTEICGDFDENSFTCAQRPIDQDERVVVNATTTKGTQPLSVFTTGKGRARKLQLNVTTGVAVTTVDIGMQTELRLLSRNKVVVL